MNEESQSWNQDEKVTSFFKYFRLILACVGLSFEEKMKKDAGKESTEDFESERAELSALQKSYFTAAKSWADDMYTAAIISRNRYKMAFFTAMGLSVLLAIAVNGLIPLQHMEPLLVNHYQDGRVLVQPLHQPYAPTNPAQVESDLVNYVINRESFDPSSYDTQYSLINLLSNNEVAKQYMNTQATTNAQSPINNLGNHGFRRVHVDNVIFLNSAMNNPGKQASQQTHSNLAQVNFTVTDELRDSASKKTKAMTVLISWVYRGSPSNPSDIWRNWNGFTVTRYSVEQRNI